MALENLKSNPIVNLDSFPVITNTIGEGCDGPLRCVNGHVAASAGANQNSTYRMVRIPTNAKVKHVNVKSAAQGTNGTVDIDVAFSDSTVDGTNQSFAGGIVQLSGPVDNKLFGSATSFAAAVPSTGDYLAVTFGNTFTTDHTNLPLWQVLVNLGATQFTADPGGFFDIVLKAANAAGLANGGDIAVEVQYVV